MDGTCINDVLSPTEVWGPRHSTLPGQFCRRSNNRAKTLAPRNTLRAANTLIEICEKIGSRQPRMELSTNPTGFPIHCDAWIRLLRAMTEAVPSATDPGLIELDWDMLPSCGIASPANMVSLNVGRGGYRNIAIAAHGDSLLDWSIIQKPESQYEPDKVTLRITERGRRKIGNLTMIDD